MNYENMPEPVPILTLTWQDVHDRMTCDGTNQEPSREQVLKVFDRLRKKLPDAVLGEYGQGFEEMIDYEVGEAPHSRGGVAS